MQMNGCKNSGLHDQPPPLRARLAGVRGTRVSEFDERGEGGCGFAAYQFSSHNQSIAEYFEQKCRGLSTALYILFPPNSHDIEERVCV